MRKIPLTKGQVALVDDDNYEALAQYKWHACTYKYTLYARRVVRVDGETRTIHMHKVIVGAIDNQDVDHWDGNGLNNQRVNLRIATRSQNQANQRITVRNTSGRRGVSWHRQSRCWRVRICRDQKQYFVGLFKDLDEAARAYDAAALELFGEFARLNFPIREAA